MVLGIAELYCGESGKKGFYNNQEIGLARAFARQGDTVIIFYPEKDKKEITREEIEPGISIVYVPARYVGDHARYDWRIMVEHHVDTVHIDCDNQIFAGTLMRFCIRNRIKYYAYLGTVGSDSDSIIKRFVMKLLFFDTKRMLKRSQCFAKTPEVKQSLQQMGIRQVQEAPVGLDTTIIPLITEDRGTLREKLGLATDKKILLFIGRLENYKRPEMAVELLKDLDDTFELIIIGIGSLGDRIRDLAGKYGVSDRVRFAGRIENSRVHSYYRACDYVINFNEKEIFGMTILEAMYQGITVTAIHAPGPDLIIENGVSGFLVDDIGAMKEIIVSGRYISSDAAKKRIEKHFSWDNTVNVIKANIPAITVSLH